MVTRLQPLHVSDPPPIHLPASLEVIDEGTPFLLGCGALADHLVQHPSLLGILRPDPRDD